MGDGLPDDAARGSRGLKAFKKPCPAHKAQQSGAAQGPSGPQVPLSVSELWRLLCDFSPINATILLTVALERHARGSLHAGCEGADKNPKILTNVLFAIRVLEDHTLG